MSTELNWQDPPADTRTDWSVISRQLRARPGAWALVRSGDRNARSLASHLKAGKYKGFVRDEFEIQVRPSAGSRGLLDVYARYVGDVA